MVGLHTLQKENYGHIGRGGFWTVVVAPLGQVLGTVVLLAGSTALAWLVFPVGVLAVLVGFVLYRAATLQARGRCRAGAAWAPSSACRCDWRWVTCSGPRGRGSRAALAR